MRAILQGSFGRAEIKDGYRPFFIGGHEGNDLVVPDEHLSLEDRLWIEPEEDRYGYRVGIIRANSNISINDKRLEAQGRYPLSSGDVIRIGRTVLTYEYEGPYREKDLFTKTTRIVQWTFSASEDVQVRMDFPIEAVISVLTEEIDTRGEFVFLFRPQVVQTLQWLQSQDPTDRRVIVLDQEDKHLDHDLVACLFERKQIRAFCPHCQQLWSASSIKREYWSTDAERQGAGGRQFLCQQGHLLMRVEDWK